MFEMKNAVLICEKGHLEYIEIGIGKNLTESQNSTASFRWHENWKKPIIGSFVGLTHLNLLGIKGSIKKLDPSNPNFYEMYIKVRYKLPDTFMDHPITHNISIKFHQQNHRINGALSEVEIEDKITAKSNGAFGFNVTVISSSIEASWKDGKDVKIYTTTGIPESKNRDEKFKDINLCNTLGFLGVTPTEIDKYVSHLLDLINVRYIDCNEAGAGKNEFTKYVKNLCSSPVNFALFCEECPETGDNTINPDTFTAITNIYKETAAELYDPESRNGAITIFCRQ